MYQFNYNEMHGDVIRRMNKFIRLLKSYAIKYDKAVTINRLYLNVNELRFNVSINDVKLLFTLDENMIIISRSHPKTGLHQKQSFTLKQIKNDEFMNYFA